MLAVSHVALLSHVTAHFEPDVEQCELCVSQAELLSAIPAANHCLPVAPETGGFLPATRFCPVTTRSSHNYLQRAPPVPFA